MLTAREREILGFLVEGDSNKTIARKLGISPRTIEHHRAHIMEKMGARTLSQLIKTTLRLPTRSDLAPISRRSLSGIADEDHGVRS